MKAELLDLPTEPTDLEYAEGIADAPAGSGTARWSIARGRPETPEERDCYPGWGPEDTPVEDLVLVPGARRRVEEAIKLAKSAVGMASSALHNGGRFWVAE